MTYTINQDSTQSTDFGYSYGQGGEVTIATGILVSSTENIGIFSAYADSHLVNHGYVVSWSSGAKGVGVQFDQSDGSVLNVAGAAITGFEDGAKFFGDRLALTNHGTIRGLTSGGVVFADTAEGCSLDNTGLIVGRSVGIVHSASSGAAEIRNSGIIKGDFYFGIYYDGGQSIVSGSLKIFNAVGGIITGRSASIVSDETESGRTVIDNRGTLNGSIVMDDNVANNVVLNRGKVNGDVLFSDGNDVFNGAGGKSGTVYGGYGKDTLAGGNAADRLNGGMGADVLTGRGGPDRFLFDTTLGPTNIDKINDFTVDLDRIVLVDYFAAAGPPGILAAARFHVGPAAADASDRIIYNPNTGALYYDHDGRGGDPQVKFAQLAPHLAIDHDDFLIGAPVK